jgi:hypothetical protein
MMNYCAAAILALCSLSASAATLGTFVGTFSGNDSVSTLQATPVLEALLTAGATQDEIDSLFFYTKLEMPTLSNAQATLSNLVPKPGEPGEYIAGDWTTVDPISLLVLKYGELFSVYLYKPAADSGSFALPEGAANAVSHISFYGFEDGGTGNEVPEPATAAVTGSALLGVALWLRRRS